MDDEAAIAAGGQGEVPSLRIRTTLLLRNDKILAARERLGLSQQALADLSGVSLEEVGAMERLQWARVRRDVEVKAQKIADVLEIPKGDVIPPETCRPLLPHKATRVDEVPLARLLSMRERLILPAPGEEMEAKEDDEQIVRALLSHMTYRCKAVICMRFGLEGNPPMTRGEVARRFNLTEGRALQIEAKALSCVQGLANAIRDSKEERSFILCSRSPSSVYWCEWKRFESLEAAVKEARAGVAFSHLIVHNGMIVADDKKIKEAP